MRRVGPGTAFLVAGGNMAYWRLVFASSGTASVHWLAALSAEAFALAAPGDLWLGKAQGFYRRE